MAELQIVTGDAETYYDKEYSLALKGKKRITTQQYVEDPRFETIGWGIALPKQEPVWTPGTASVMLNSIDWDNTAMVFHNAKFDGAILDYHYGIHPKYLFCTMAMAQVVGIGKLTGSVSLAALAEFFELPAKGTTVHEVSGLRLADFPQELLADYGEYCCHDVWLTRRIFEILYPYVDAEEILWHSKIHKAFTEPCVKLDTGILEAELERVRARSHAILEQTAAMVGCTVDQLPSKLRSAKQFAELLEDNGVKPPMKISPSNGKPTYAFSKKDTAFVSMADHENEVVRELVRAKLGAASTMEETRLVKMIALSKLPSKLFRMPMKISGAHTHRLSGEDSLNVQNWPSGRVDGQSKQLRRSICVRRAGEKITAPDSGQIEARVLAFVANDTELLGLFERGECPYSAQAAGIYGEDRDVIYKGAKAYGGGDKDSFKYYIMRQTGKAAILQLGYQAGKAGFYDSLTGTYGVQDATPEQCDKIVAAYRKSRKPIVKFWGTCENVIRAMMQGRNGYFGGPTGKLFYFDGNRDLFGKRVPSIKLPNNTWLLFPMLREIKEDWRTNTVYIQDMGMFKRSVAKGGNKAAVLAKQGKRLYGGSLTENLCQALAFCALKWQAMRMDGKYIGNVHDEHLMITTSEEQSKHYQTVMRTSPPYLTGLQFDCEYEEADNYGDC